MSDLMRPAMPTVVFLVLPGVVWAYVATTTANTNVPEAQKGIITFVGILFTLGGSWVIWKMFERAGELPCVLNTVASGSRAEESAPFVAINHSGYRDGGCPRGVSRAGLGSASVHNED